MTALLCRLFVKNRKNTSDPAVRRAYGTMASIVGIVVNLILFTGKLAIGTLAGAISITADAFNNLSDAGSQIISLVSFRMASKPADRDHPFGHARIEYVASMIVSFLVLTVGFELLTGSIDKLIHPASPSRDNVTVTVCVLGAAILGKLWLGIFNRSLAKKIDSSVMRATAADSLSDALSTAAVLVGMIIYIIFEWVWVDAVMGLIVSLLILWAGIKILNETKNSILGERPSDEIVTSIRDVVSSYPDALGIHDMVVHNYGPGRTIASLHVEVDGKGDLFALHDTIDNIEKQLVRELGIEATIHMDPIVTNDVQVQKLRTLTAEAVGGIDERLHIHDFRCVIGQTHTNLIFDIAAPYELKISNSELCDAVDAALKRLDARFNTVITVDRE
ncbi:MAG: cation transporter [Clostridia bacterium]|nr:cation transporter [Clostridia bacterium]